MKISLQFLSVFAPLLMSGALLVATPASAQSMLEISGETELTRNGPVTLTIDQFEALAPLTTLQTSTPWHKKTVFSGISGADFMRAVKATGTTLVARAINDYETNIPLNDLVTLGLVFVTRIDGKRITLREKGPVFVIYPFDQNPELRSELYYGRSIWQVTKLTFK